ncbi:hypothetical protein BU197_18350 [Streptomyces sp. CBMA291]|nr:hypothetical protein [Streptomyces sp. CBMA291]MBD0712869.1 hypothetical protein [Streptomyces sp. CBMA370]
MRLRTERFGAGTLARVDGEIDMDTAGELEAALTRTLTEGPPGASLALDLSGVSFCDSSGLNTLLRLRLLALSHRTPLTIPKASPRVTHLLTLTGTADLFGHPGSATG